MAARFMSHAQRLQKPLTFMLVDVDRFREVNTRFGHLAGDVVSAEIASLLKRAMRGSDAVIRYGGDEFLVIRPMRPRLTRRLWWTGLKVVCEIGIGVDISRASR